MNTRYSKGLLGAVGSGLLLLILFTSCTSGVLPPPPVYPPQPTVPGTSPDTAYADRLVRQFGWSDTHVIRWPDGYVDVYDQTGYPRLQEVLMSWNELMGGRTVFRLSTDPNSPVRVRYDETLGYDGICGQAELWLIYGGYAIGQAQVLVNPNDFLCPLHATFLHEFGHVVGFGKHTSDGGVMDPYNTGSTIITQTVRTMIQRLYELPVGMPLQRDLNSDGVSDIIGERVFRSH